MMKEVRSWSKPKGIPGLIGRKKVDQSLFKYGTHIPIAFHEDFKAANEGAFYEKSHSKKIRLLINNELYDAKLFNFAKQGTTKDTLHIRYDHNKELIYLLKSLLKNSYGYLNSQLSKKSSGDRSLIEVPDEYAEYIDFFKTEDPYKYRLEIITSKEEYKIENNYLAAPFSEIFKDREEANLAFDFLKKSCERLGILGPDDLRISVTLRQKNRVLRLNFGNWAVLQFYSPEYSKYNIGIPLIDDQVNIEGQHKKWTPFANSDPSISGYDLHVELGKPLENNIEEVYKKTLSLIAERFKNWKGSPVRFAHQPDIAEAIFDNTKREELFIEGIATITNDEEQNVWWVNQGSTIKEEKEGGFIWAPIISKNGRSQPHGDTLEELREDDLILHYANGSMRYISKVVFPWIPSEEPSSFGKTDWEKEGRLVQVEYHELDPPIPLEKFSKELGALYIHQGPINREFRVKQGYLYRMNRDGLKLVKDSQPETEWPDFVDDYLGSESKINYWIFQGNPKIYDIVSALKDNALKTWLVSAHKSDIQKGDKVIIWVTGSSAGCYALGTVTSDVYKGKGDENDQKYNRPGRENREIDRVNLSFDYNLSDDPIKKSDIKENVILKDLKVGNQGTNFTATKEQYDELKRIALKRVPKKLNPPYSIEEFINNTFVQGSELASWLNSLKRKKQVILYGPPGTGKTFLAKHLAQFLIAESDGFSEIVQFHPAYAYEDFVQGIRPQLTEGGQLDYAMIPGRFLEFCRKASSRKGTCVLIIDEINRANLARVLGELMFLLEYRNEIIPLAGGGELSIPDNVRIIGTMNTADRSIALVDHALRRRFAFIALRPNYEVLEKFHEAAVFQINKLIDVLKKLNVQIGDRHYEIGISFFLKEDLQDHIEDIWKMEIEPYLEEYFFDQQDKVDNFRWEKIYKEIQPL